MRLTMMIVTLVVLGLAAGESRAVTPVPRVYYDFEKIVGGEFFVNVISPGNLDGHFGVSPSDSLRHPDLVTGLHGSAAAVKFDSNDIARVPGLIVDANADRVDENIFAGAYSVFARIDPSNVAQMNVVNADRGPISGTTVRGWYMDFSNSTTNGSGEHLLRPRFTTGGGPTLHANGSETTNYKNVESYAVTWLPSSNPGVTSDGLMQIYINGQLLAQQNHNLGANRVGEAGFSIGLGEGVSYGNGIVIDDLAVWSRFLTAADIQEIHLEGVTTPEPGTCALLVLGALAMGLFRPLRKRTASRA